MIEKIINLFIKIKNTLHMCKVIEESDNYHSLRKKEEEKDLLSILFNI